MGKWSKHPDLGASVLTPSQVKRHLPHSLGWVRGCLLVLVSCPHPTSPSSSWQSILPSSWGGSGIYLGWKLSGGEMSLPSMIHCPQGTCAQTGMLGKSGLCLRAGHGDNCPILGWQHCECAAGIPAYNPPPSSDTKHLLLVCLQTRESPVSWADLPICYGLDVLYPQGHVLKAWSKCSDVYRCWNL